jgi:putative FmdB family regulatory protein
MPTYSYRCTACGTAFDVQQAFTDDSLTECPTCGGRLRKLFSAVGVTFNGSGFYRTDSRASVSGGGGSKAEGSGGSSSAGSSSGGSGSTSGSSGSSSGSTGSSGSSGGGSTGSGSSSSSS